MADALGIIGFLGTCVAFGELAVRSTHMIEKTKGELHRQWTEYDVIRLILQEAVQASTFYGKPTGALEATMRLCAENSQEFEMELYKVQDALDKKKRVDRFFALCRATTRRNERRFAFEAFRDTTLLLRDLATSMQTSNQLKAVMSDLTDLQTVSSGSESQSQDEEWDPEDYQRRTGLNLDDLTLSKPQRSTGRPLQNFDWNYTFDATIKHVTGDSWKPIPVRGLWDTGSDEFMIAQEILDRAGISDSETVTLHDAPTFHGVNGAEYTPKRSIKLTWNVNRNMNTRQDTFYITDDAKFDILVPGYINIGIKHTGPGGEGLNALILQFRKKSRKEKEKDQVEETKAQSAADAAAQAKADAKRVERLALLQKRKAAGSGTVSSSTSGSP